MGDSGGGVWKVSHTQAVGQHDGARLLHALLPGTPRPHPCLFRALLTSVLGCLPALGLLLVPPTFWTTRASTSPVSPWILHPAPLHKALLCGHRFRYRFHSNNRDSCALFWQRGSGLRKVVPYTQGCTAVCGSTGIQTQGGLFSGSAVGLPFPVSGHVREE